MQLTPGAFLPQTKQQFVYRTLRDAIMRCELRPGQRLVIEDVARQLGVSPIPVREALQLLQSERLVNNVPHVGAVVSAITSNSIAETFTVLEGLEMVGTRAAAGRLTPEGARELEGLVADMDSALARDQWEAWGDLNTRFHVAIARLTEMPLLIEMTERAFSQWDRLRRYFFRGSLPSRAEASQQQHKDLLAALRSQDYEAIESIVRTHNRDALKAYMDHLASHPTLPDESDRSPDR